MVMTGLLMNGADSFIARSLMRGLNRCRTSSVDAFFKFQRVAWQRERSPTHSEPVCAVSHFFPDFAGSSSRARHPNLTPETVLWITGPTGPVTTLNLGKRSKVLG